MSVDRLAINGGAPTIPAGPPPWPRAREDVREALEAAFADASWGKYHGGYVQRLEAELAAMHNVAHALVCSSGTIAVELALRGLKIGQGDEVLLAGYDFPGNFRAIEAIGARPVLVDIEPTTWCLDAAQLTEAIGPQTKAVIVSHLHGGIADMQTIVAICRERGVRVVEDACQAPGGLVQGRMAGTWGDVGVLSFGGSKVLTAGRGGAVITNDPHVAQRITISCDRGNHAFPLSELQAAVLLPQLQTLQSQNFIRQSSAANLIEAVRATRNLQPVDSLGRGVSSYYKLAWLRSAEAPWPRERFVSALQAEGVAIDSGFRGFVGRSTARCRRVGGLTSSKAASQRTVLLHHPVLLESEATIQLVAAAIDKVCQQEATEAADPP